MYNYFDTSNEFSKFSQNKFNEIQQWLEDNCYATDIQVYYCYINDILHFRITTTEKDANKSISLKSFILSLFEGEDIMILDTNALNRRKLAILNEKEAVLWE